MKITFLVNQVQSDGSVCLCVATHEEWLAVVNANKLLPLENQRYFIRDCIEDGGELDWLIMETPRSDYLKWHREHIAMERNRSLGQQYELLSADTFLPTGGEMIRPEDVLTSGEQVEDTVCDGLFISELRKELAAWKPWGNDLLDMYLQGKKKSCTELIAKKYGVSLQAVRKYKRQLEEFIKNFEGGVSF